jgi:hypothetical protein
VCWRRSRRPKDKGDGAIAGNVGVEHTSPYWENAEPLIMSEHDILDCRYPCIQRYTCWCLTDYDAPSIKPSPRMVVIAPS